MHKFLPKLMVAAAVALCGASCSGHYGGVDYAQSPKVINVSEWDPKEKQRGGEGYSPLDQRALKRNGAHGLIARCAKGTANDRKCGAFLLGAERQGLRIGTYYYVQPFLPAKRQARHYVQRMRELKRGYGLRSGSVLLAADFDTKCSAEQMVGFVQEIHRQTGAYPLVYLENGEPIRQELRSASRQQKAILRRCPYWLALYSHEYPGIPTPKELLKATDVWDDWALWQYGGVFWKGGRSQVYHYNAGSWRTPEYFGTMDRPLERNGFNGSVAELHAMWSRHSWQW